MKKATTTPSLRATAGSILLVIAVVTGALVNPPRAVAHHSNQNVTGRLSQSWGEAQFSVKRDGWGITVWAMVTDKARDGHAVYVEAKAIVSASPDPDAVVVRGRGAGTSTRNKIRLSPHVGEFITKAELKLCRADRGRDTCVKKTVGVPQPGAHYGASTRVRSWADWYMGLSPGSGGRHLALGSFITIRTNPAHRYHGSAYNWSSNGCTSVPDRGPRSGINFRKACDRHDFGYRNYGNRGGLEIKPTDHQRRRIDNRFYWDMIAICDSSTRAGSHGRSLCHADAYTYWQGVRKLGARAFFG